MDKVKVLKDNELVGGTDNTSVYPITHTKAIFDGNNKELDQRLNENDDDRELLHRQSEKLVLSLASDMSGAIEINGTQRGATFTAKAVTETFGDEPTITLNPDDYEYSFINATFVSKSTIDISAIVTLPTTVGAFTTTFNAIYNGVSKSASVTANMNLRKFFGFSETLPSDIAKLSTSHFSNYVGCTITIPTLTTGKQYKYIYFAVPESMTISDVRQPDALNAPLAFQNIGTITRTVGDINYTYKLYKSADLIDSTVSKRLTIS